MKQKHWSDQAPKKNPKTQGHLQPHGQLPLLQTKIPGKEARQGRTEEMTNKIPKQG